MDLLSVACQGQPVLFMCTIVTFLGSHIEGRNAELFHCIDLLV